MTLLSVPSFLWNLYVQNLWYYQRGSWIDSAAYTFRFLAFVVIAPFVLLTLLDVTSYVIARTLGVIDDTKASTSETGPPTDGPGTPSIVIQSESTSGSSQPATTPPSTFFRNPLEEEGNLRLSGVGMFSPAPSQPPSPTMSRRELDSHMHNVPEEYRDEMKSGFDSGRDLSREPRSGDSSSGESSYAMLEQESGTEDAQVTLRRRITNLGSEHKS
ncbi:hypothetical protein POSPLADRAFT_1052960 [Postia placenta MAD-698-R-SB12]|uniref:Uncharacterized protein n=1 Tax=Postia placenta MAD-698-R-SB12 TaxID=670580 RepID=A0A1X6ND48_9APHY|nr:hypothetical protein POSPLADRAFT_1052960 [Postia placenta MAD-698-R-SB12]OSX66303.1 hypothetical protein POSPLADRAFT_1052960 [Postia placenta MAD-698-R-SB12]